MGPRTQKHVNVTAYCFCITLSLCLWLSEN